MKLRIHGDSLRLRVTRSEVARLPAGDCLEETIHFAPEPGAKFTYALQTETSVRRPAVPYAGSKVTVLIPAGQAKAWGVSDKIAIAEEISLGDLETLALPIEKDFACLNRSNKDKEYTFPNPNAGAKCQARPTGRQFLNNIL
jgi:hypothetical protein